MKPMRPQSPQEELEALDRAIALKPDCAEAYFRRGDVLQDLGRMQDALASYDQAVTFKNDYAAAYCNRGNVLKDLKRFEQALENYDHAIALQPDLAAAHHNRGIVLQKLDRLEEALASYDRMIALQPDFPPTHYNRGNVLKDLKRLTEAVESYDRTIALLPDHAMSHVNKALILLLLGNYREGWPLYEWRWKHELKGEARRFTQPLWLGEEPLVGRTLLIHSEQGLGDAIQFCRYAKMAEDKGAKVVLEAPQELVSVLKTLSGDITFIEKVKPLPKFDLQCPMMSLPLAFKTTVETVPDEIPYLFADRDKKVVWREKLGTAATHKIGLAWSGRTGHKNDRQRSLELKTLIPLMNLPFEFHSLQTEYRENEKPLLESLPNLKDHSGELKDFSDTAALISEMDLILSVDTSVAHLAGALGKKVWILLPSLPDFRWLLKRPDSPWYPTVKLWRQPESGRWEPVLKDVVEELKREF